MGKFIKNLIHIIGRQEFVRDMMFIGFMGSIKRDQIITDKRIAKVILFYCALGLIITYLTIFKEVM